MKSKLSLLHIFLSLALVLFIISAAVVVTLNFKTLYYFDIDFLNIPAYSGYSRETIIENYDALIRYNSLFGPKTLEFPSLAMSESGRIYFEEVKVVFNFFEITAMVSGILSALGIVYCSKGRYC
jgi:integral membrane protein (TIGR01906 family)